MNEKEIEHVVAETLDKSDEGLRQNHDFMDLKITPQQKISFLSRARNVRIMAVRSLPNS